MLLQFVRVLFVPEDKFGRRMSKCLETRLYDHARLNTLGIFKLHHVRHVSLQIGYNVGNKFFSLVYVVDSLCVYVRSASKRN